LVINVNDLYGLPLDRFVAERGALAKTLRAEGDRTLAASVAGRRKPSLAAWAVNQLVRTQSGAVAYLFDAGDALVRVQSELLAGRGDARALRDAVERERAALAGLMAAARGLLSAEGHELTHATLERVSATLSAAALDEGARAEIREGCLERELRHVGLGATALIASPAPGRRPDAERRAQAARAEELKAAQKAEAAARRAAQRAQRELETAQTRRDRAATSFRDAEDALAGAREHAEEAARAHRRAQQSLDDGVSRSR
jgi:hypothetical protein